MRAIWVLFWALFSAVALAQALPEAALGPAPVMPSGNEPPTRAALQAQASTTASSVTVDPNDRYQVSVLYRTTYVAEGSAVNGWTGSVSPCDPGSTAQAFQDATLERVNVYRALAGLPGNVTEFGNATDQTDDQNAALIFLANQALSHAPANTWTCYTAAGYTGAASSNISLGYSSASSSLLNGPVAIDNYIEDDGNGTAINDEVGHRRWLLYPPQINMATGDVGPLFAAGIYVSGSYYFSANALWVFGPYGSRPAVPDGIAWPPRGYVPWQLLPSVSNRWSLSMEYANFDSASVSMTRNGVALPNPTLDPTAYNGQGLGQSYIGDNTLVWEPSGVTYAQPGADVTYHVTVSGITGNGGNSVPSSVSYDVIVINPYDAIFADGFDN